MSVKAAAAITVFIFSPNKAPDSCRVRQAGTERRFRLPPSLSSNPKPPGKTCRMSTRTAAHTAHVGSTQRVVVEWGVQGPPAAPAFVCFLPETLNPGHPAVGKQGTAERSTLKCEYI